MALTLSHSETERLTRVLCADLVVVRVPKHRLVDCEIGTEIGSQAILWMASVATVLQVMMWLLVFVAHVRALLKKQILWPGKDEDHDS